MPEFNIDPNFSLYNLLRRKQDAESTVSNRVTMSKISYLIEETTRQDHEGNLIFSSFQYLSKFERQIDRYRQIAQHAEHVYIFGVPDKPMPEIQNLTCVPLKPTDELAREWFIVSHGANYSAALATQEISDFHDPDHEREFTGVLLFDEALVNILASWLYRTVGQQVDIDDESVTVNMERRIYLINQLNDRLQSMMSTTREMPVVRGELSKFYDIAQAYLQTYKVF